jgi:hypothetical protein
MLKDYLEARFSSLSNQLNWTETNYELVVEDTLELYGVIDESLATDTNKLHKLGIYSFLKAALTEISLDYGFSIDGSSFSRNQAFNQLQSLFLQAERDASPYLPGNLEIGEITFEENPYSFKPLL